MELAKNLQQLGLTENQAKVYISCLQLGVDTVLNIAKIAELKRPTVYLILDELENLGLVSKTKKASKSLFKAETPEKLVTDLKIKTETANNLLPSLKAIYNLDPEKPNIKIADGVAGARNVYKEIFTYLKNNPSEELLIFGSLKDAKENFQDQVIDFFYETAGKSKNQIREIGNDDVETRKYYRNSHKINPRHDIRLIRDEGEFTLTDNMLYGNTLVIFSVKKQIFATIIESASITKTYRTLFNMAWRSGKQI
jgi:sugar-specific transcriptional regulator TrmB